MAGSSSIFNSDPVKHPVKLFLAKLGAFLLLIAALDLLAGVTLRHFYFTQTSGVFYRITYSLEKTREPLLIFGSSRANHHYVPDVFEKKFNRPYYNVGQDGQSILFNLAVLRSVLKRYTPGVIVLDFNLYDFDKDSAEYQKLAVLLPYYGSHPEIRDIIEMRGRFEKIKLLSKTYPFNSSLLTILVGNMEMNKARRGDQKGYIPLFSKMGGPFKEPVKKPKELDPVKVRAYADFISESKQAGARLFVVVSPYCMEMEGPSRDLARRIAAEHQTRFLDYSQDTYFLERPELFSDASHLNEGGAKIFSGRAADEMGRG